MENICNYVFVFEKTPDTMRAYEYARVQYSDQNVIIMPTPNQIDQSCGLAVSIRGLDLNEQICFLNSLEINAALFELTVSIDEKGTKRIVSAVKVGETGSKTLKNQHFPVD